MKFQKKPLIIDAIQWTGSNYEEICKFVGEELTYRDLVGCEINQLEIDTREGTMVAKVNDWIIRGVFGEFYPCKPHIFEETYDRVI